MNIKNFCIHYARRCFFSRTLLVVLASLTISVLANCLLVKLILLFHPPCNCGENEEHYQACYVNSDAGLAANLLLSVNDLKSLQSSIDTDLILKENYVKELNLKISLLKNEVISLQQSKVSEEDKLAAIQRNVYLAEDRLKVLQANFTPKLLPPFRAVNSQTPVSVTIQKSLDSCSFISCFDFSRCPLFFSLGVFPYGGKPSFEELRMYPTVTNGSEACIFLYQTDTFSIHLLDKLAYMNVTNNMNHIILSNGNFEASNALPSLMIGAVSFSLENSFRKGFDFLVPFVSGCSAAVVPKTGLLPIMRPIIFSFVELPDEADSISISALSHLRRTKPTTGDSVSSIKVTSMGNEEICQDKSERLSLFSNSTFVVVVHHLHYEFGVVFSEILQSNSIPVILYSNDNFELPLAEVIDWQKAAISLPIFRVSEVYYLLKSLSVSELASYKLEGRRIFEQFSSSISSVWLGIFSTLNCRLHLPAPALPDFEAKSAYFPQKYAPTVQMDAAPFIEDGLEISFDDYLGPLEMPKPSEKSYRFFIETSNYIFGAPTSPYLQPFPHDIALKANHNLDFRPIALGLVGRSDRELGFSLGGNLPAEQFTIVILTQGGDRLPILVDIVSRLKNLPYLNKVIIVWNDELNSPPADLKWPELIVPIFVAKMSKNSLNNRFLPFSEIETDAVLSVDDDMFLRPDEIIFAFRTWRDYRDRIVGFPSRSHGWNATTQQWIYVSDYSCEYSLVLTGAAFIHKYYFYMYTYLMPVPIREYVDKLMNCEDIAMNFLVAHLTRKAPIKVTVRWTFHCPTCKTHLWKEQTHFNERSECIQQFSDIYGYNPLLFSQSRADSVLFKTRVPSTYKKCFKYV